MKQFMFKVMLPVLLMLGGVNSVLAQSTYTWDATKWISDGNGSISSVSDNTITGQAGTYLFGLQYNGDAFKLPKRQTFIVIKGVNILKGNEPKLHTLNGENIDLGDFTVNDAHTLAYKDITANLPAETDFFGNVTINGATVWLQKPGGGNPADIQVTSIDFVAADILDVAQVSNISEAASGTIGSISLEAAAGDFKKVLTYTQTSTNGDAGILISGINAQLNNSDMFFVIESDNSKLNTNSRIKLREFWVEGTKYQTNNGGASVAGADLGDGHYLYIHNFYTRSDNSATLLEQWEQHTTMNSSAYKLYTNNSQNTVVKIYRMGFYNLAEILAMYPSMSNQPWRFQKPEEGHVGIEKGGDANKIKINNGQGAGMYNTTAYAAQMIRSLGTLPAYFTKIELRKFKFADGQQPLKEDIFRDLSHLTEIFVNNDEYQFFPTMKTCVKVAGGNYKYTQFKDGVAPGSTPAATTDGAGNNPWTSVTRYFKAGYNTCFLPFSKPQYAELPAALTAYTFTSATDGNIVFTKQTANSESATKGVPVIVHAETDGLYMILGRDAETSFENDYTPVTHNDISFVGSYVEEIPTASGKAYESYADMCFGITSDGANFAKMGASTKTTYYRAFLVDGRTSAGRALFMSFSDGDVTSISEELRVKSEEFATAPYYNLAGQRVEKPTRGLYIVNGKKVVIK